MKPNVRIVATIAATIVLAGCASTRGLEPESSVNDANRLAASKSLQGVQTAGAAWPVADWWKAFGDPQLDQLVTEALADSPTLRIAAARTRKALASSKSASSTLYPHVNGELDVERQRFPAHALVPPPFGGGTATLYQLQATLDWEIDFWGKSRALYDSALGEARATLVDEYATKLALSSSIAQTYVQMERAYLRLDVAEATLKEREQIYALTRDRNAAGIDSRLELKQAEAAVPATREQVAQLHETIELSRNQIAALLGQGPDRGLAIARPRVDAGGPFALPSVLPAELLGRRPDIVAQRERLHAAQRDIAAAKAEFYPNVNLMAFVGLQSLGAAGFLSAASRSTGLGPAATLPIFDAGRLRARLAGKDADYDVAVERYNQTLANAMRDVVDQIVSMRSVDAQLQEQTRASAASREAYDLALLRYREGIGNYLQVLSAESPLLAQQGLDAELRSRKLELSIDLVRALGGGYTEAAIPAVVAR